MDLAPPLFISTSALTDFTNFTLTVSLNEPGEVYGILASAAAVASNNVSLVVAWPPTYQVCASHHGHHHLNCQHGALW